MSHLRVFVPFSFSFALLAVPATAQVPSAGLRLWLRADQGVSSTTDLVDSWTDRSGAGHVFTASGTQRPTIVTGSGVSLVRFQGQQELRASLPFVLQSATIFALFRYRIPTSANDYLYAFGVDGRSGSQMTLSRRGGLRAYHYDGAVVNTGGTIPSGRWLVSTQVFGAGAAGSHTLSIDGTTVLTSTSAGYSADFTSARIGDWTGCCYRFWGDVAELIVYDRVLTATERAQVEAQLAAKAGRAFAIPIGASCAGTSGTPGLAVVAGSRPVSGQVFRTRTSPVPAGALVFVLVGFNDTNLGSTTLPTRLDAFRMPGCWLHLSAEVVVPVAAVGTAAAWNLTIPNDPALLRAAFHLQSIVRDPGANPLGLTSTNALTASVGS